MTSCRHRLPLLYQGTKPRAKLCCCSSLFFTWVTAIINFTKEYGKLEVEYLGELNDEDRVEIHLERLERAWDSEKLRYKENGQAIPTSALFYTVFNTFKWDYLRIVALTTITAAMNICGPFLIDPLIDFIQNGKQPKDDWFPVWDTSGISWLSWLDADRQFGLSIAMAIVLTQALTYVVQETVSFRQALIGCQSCNALIGLIYKK